jgi:Flp pilus assembly protein protease CpaA
MNTAPRDEVEAALPPSLRFLKWLVIVLTLTMIGGVITVVGLLVTRIPQGFGTLPVLPAAITLPEGTTPQAMTFGRGWIGVVVTGPEGERFLVFSPTGEQRQTVDLTAP